MFRIEFFVVLLPFRQRRNCPASLPYYFHICKQLTATPLYRAISVSARNQFLHMSTCFHLC